MKKILIYQDYGCSINTTDALHSYFSEFAKNKSIKIESYDAANIISKGIDLKTVAAFIMPGGHSRAFAKKLDGDGNKIIRDFVKAGGLYYGFCGGAYYACKNIDFTGADFKIKRQHELCFSTGEAIGSLPHFTNGNNYSENSYSANALELSYGKNLSKVFCYYNGGPKFILGNTDNEKALATYSDGTIALTECKVGDGYAILCAVHPEMTSERIQTPSSEEAENYAHIKNMSKKLSEDTNAQDDFKEFLLRRI